MTQIEFQIVELLNKGFSYSKIQESLQVSSKTISSVKKANDLISLNNSDNAKTNTFQLKLKTQSGNTLPSTTARTERNHTFPIVNPENTRAGNEIESNQVINTNFELEKYRIELAHILELEKLKVSKEEKERAHSLLEEELNLRRFEIANSINKPISDKQSLLNRIKEIIVSCEDGDYSFDEISDLSQKTWKVLSDCEQYCHSNGITFQGTVSHTLLTKIIEIFVDVLERIEEDETGYVEFDNAVRKQFNSNSFKTF